MGYMGLYKLFSCNVEIQYRGYLLSKAMLFTVFTTLLNIILPFVVAYRSRGFWLRSNYFYERPTVYSTYNYLLVVETDDPKDVVVCGDAQALSKEALVGEEYCSETQIQEHDLNDDAKYDRMDFKFILNLPSRRTVTSIVVLLELDYHIRSTCPLQMKTLAVASKEFALPPSSYLYHGDVKFYQTVHLPCLNNVINTKYNSSIFEYVNDRSDENVVDFLMKHYLRREVKTELKTAYSRTSFGHTGSLNINIYLQFPEAKITYMPSLLQELKWAWPQYLSLAVVFYWFFERVKKFVFNNRLFMAWEIVPWKRNQIVH